MAALQAGGFMQNTQPEGVAHELGATTRIVGENEPTIALIPASDAISQSLEHVLMPSQFMQYSNDFALPGTSSLKPQRMVNAAFSIGGAGTPFAFDVYLRYDGKEQRLGELTSGEAAREANDFMDWGGIGGNQRMIATTVENELPETVELVFRPSEKVARRTIDLKEIYNAEIIVRDVRVQSLGR
jgi:hypothetical protein